MVRDNRLRRRRGLIVVATLVVTASASALSLQLADRVQPATAASTTTSSTPAPTTTSRPPPTTTTIAVGSLPQTRALPPAITRGLTQRMRALVSAIGAGDAGLGISSFFPLHAYLQTKIYADAAHDWRTRLIPEFAADLHALHRALDPTSAPMRLLGYSVDDGAAVWVLPGEEFNKGPYWRVYDTTVSYAIGALRGSFSVNTMISWRGEWYVAHVANFNT
jgi:hypothetical protein